MQWIHMRGAQRPPLMREVLVQTHAGDHYVCTRLETNKYFDNQGRKLPFDDGDVLRYSLL